MELAERDTRIGSVVDGRYKILDPMAAGSMGVVYRAERVPVGKPVAIKFLHAAFAGDPEFLGRFERETRVMSKLTHPHCVSVVDFGVAAGEPYLVMDFVSGTTLAAILDEAEHLAVPRALAITRQVLAGLAHAHGQGIVHRDIKPANLMITDEIGTGEHVRILDFGLARLRGALNANATQSNVVVGTPSYMAPEQTVDAAVDARADLYAVGVVLYEMITGDKPFRAENTLELFAMHRGAPVPRLADRAPVGAAVPSGLQAILDRALAKDPEDRYQNAIEFADAIDALTSAPLQPVALPPPPRDASSRTTSIPRRGSAFGTWLLLLTAGALASAWYLVREPEEPPPPAPRSTTPAATATTPREPVVAPPAPAAPTAPAPAIAPADAAPVAIDPLADAGVALVDLPDAMPAAVTDASITVVLGGDDAGLTLEIEPLADEPEPDPETAEDPDPIAAAAAESEHDEDEAADAPAVVPEPEKEPPPPAPQPLARSVEEAVRMIKAGKRELALQSLRQLWKKRKASAYIPFLLGNLYADKKWWSVALDHYRIAIAKNKAYKKNGTLNRNVIRMLSSKKTAGKASYFLRKTIGRPAKPHLKHAAKHHKNAKVRKSAAALNRRIR